MQKRYNYIPMAFGEVRYAKTASSGPELLAETLSWAAANGIPFHEALLTLTLHGSPLRCITWMAFFKYRNWDFCLRVAAGDLMAGKSLSEALRRLRYFLPDYYIAGIEEAERNGSLEKTLPAFADSMQTNALVRRSYWRSATYPFVEMLFMFPFIILITVFIAPKFAKIMNSLMEGTSRVPWRFLESMGKAIPAVLGIFLVIVFMYMVLRRFRSGVMEYLEIPLFLLPFFRKQFRAIGMMELAVSMAACLKSGMDVVGAVELSRRACRHFWLRRRLRRCGEKLKSGIPFTTAWQVVAKNDPMSEFFAAGAAEKGTLAEGFAAMTEWNMENSLRTARINSIWLMLGLLSINVMIVFVMEYAVFRSLVRVIEKMSNHIW